MDNNFEKELNVLCDKIADWLNQKIDIPNVPEFIEKIIFNRLVMWVAQSILNLLKKGGTKNV